MHIIIDRISFFTIYHYILITIALLRLHVNYGIIFMQKRKFHQLYLSLSQNLKNKIYLELTNLSVKTIGNIILRQLRNKASKAYLFKDFFIWCESMFILWVWIWRKCDFSPGYPRYTQQRDELFKQLIDISVPFYMNYILYGSSDFSYR